MKSTPLWIVVVKRGSEVATLHGYGMTIEVYIMAYFLSVRGMRLLDIIFHKTSRK